MSETTILTDVAAGIYVEEHALDSAAGTIRKRRMRGGVSDGVDVIDIDNGALSFSVIPTRGMGVWKGSFKGHALGWESPVSLPVHPAYVNLLDRDKLGWLHGFNEWICRCGLNFMGPPGDGITLHGRIANLPAHRVEISAERDCLEVTGVVDETSMFGPRLRLTSTIGTTAGANSLTVTDRVQNLGGQPAELEMLYHINVGRPFLEGGSKLRVPFVGTSARDARAEEGLNEWDVYAAPEAGYAEQAYFFTPAADEDGQAHTLLRNAAGDLGMHWQWPAKQLPCLTLWKNTQAEADGYVTGIEPGTAYPNPKDEEREQGRLVTLPPGGEWHGSFQIAIYDSPNAIADVERRIDELHRRQSKHSPS